MTVSLGKARKQEGMTLIELMVVIALIALLAGLYLPAINRTKAKGVQVKCLGNLRQIGLAYRLFADDHKNSYPMEISLFEGGTRDFVTSGNTAKHFQVLSNYLDKTKLLVCPADKLLPADSWPTLLNTNVSYFAGLDANYGNATHFLAGDRNIAVDLAGNSSIVWLNVGEQVSWTQEMHQGEGNVLFADNHVEMLNNDQLRVAIHRSLKTAH